MSFSSDLIKKESQLYVENQVKIVKQIVEIDKSLFSYFYKNYMIHTYYFINYNISTDKDICYKLAMIFSEYPDSFSGKVRTEIQLDNNSVTLCVNDWIKCKPLSSIETNFEVEYYISTVNNFPVIIFFRIKKNIDKYETKLQFYINHLLGNKLQNHILYPIINEKIINNKCFDNIELDYTSTNIEELVPDNDKCLDYNANILDYVENIDKPDPELSIDSNESSDLIDYNFFFISSSNKKRIMVTTVCALNIMLILYVIDSSSNKI